MSKIQYQEKGGKVYCPLKDKWLMAKPEEKVRQRYIITLVNEYGYKLEQMAQELQVNNSQRGQGKASADIVIWKSKDDKDKNKAAFIVIECKADNVKVRVEDYYQGYNYASWAHADFFVTTNLKETKYFNIDPEFLPQKLNEVVNIPTAKEALIQEKVNDLKNQTKVFTREEFTKVLQSCHNIIRNNDKLSPEAAFDEISKLLFMKIRYERRERGKKVFTHKEYLKLADEYEKNQRPGLKLKGIDQSYMQNLFDTTKAEFADDHLFEENDDIKIRETSFIQILEKLESFNLSDTQDDVKGIAFEQFLGTTFRGELGQFFTPRTIVDFMTEILDPQEGELVCDPTCGSGGFLIKVFEYIREKIENDVRTQKNYLRFKIEGENFETKSEDEQLDIVRKIENMQMFLNSELDTAIKDSRMYNLSRNCIFGTDANPRMARTSKMNMIMHGDGHGGVHHHDGLLNVNGIFEERFDVILTNPPFGQIVDSEQLISEVDRFTDENLKEKYIKKYGSSYLKALKQVDDNIGKKLLSLFDLGEKIQLTEVLFMERCLKLLKKGGRMGIVLPEGVLNNKKTQKVRDYFEGKAKLLLICSIPQDVFMSAKATVKPSLIFIKKFTEEEEKEYKRCKESARKEVFGLYHDEINKIKVEISSANENLERLKDELKTANQMLRSARKKSLSYLSEEGKVLQIKSEQKENKELKERKEKELKTLIERIEDDIKSLIKFKFDYLIPIADIKDAGITTSGSASSGNQLPVLMQEFIKYKTENSLWDDLDWSCQYKEGDGIYTRKQFSREVILNG